MKVFRFGVAASVLLTISSFASIAPASAAITSTTLVVTAIHDKQPANMTTDANYLYVSTIGLDSAVYKIDQKTMSIVDTFDGATLGFKNPRQLLLDGNHLWVICYTGANVETLIEIDVTTGTVLRSIPGSTYGGGIVVAKMMLVGDNIWMPLYRSVAVIDRTTGALVTKVTANSISTVSDIAYDGTNVWISSWYPSDNITIIKASDYSVVTVLDNASYKFDQPWAMAFDGTSMWVASYYEGVDKIDVSDFTVKAYISSTQITGTFDAEYYDGTVWFLNQAQSLVTPNQYGSHFTGVDPVTATVTKEMNEQGGGYDGSGNVMSFTANGIFGVSPSPSLILRLLPSTPPSTPVAPTATAGDGSATITWTAPTSSGSSAVSGYYVTSSPAGGTCYKSSGTSCTITGLTNGTSYTFKVTAYNGQGSSGASPSSNSVTPSGPPTAPTSVIATASDGAVVVSWSAPSSNGGSAITGYTVTASPGGATCQTTTLTCTVSGLTNGTAYSFTVTATNANGESSGSSSVSATPAVPAPSISVAPVLTDTTANGRFTQGDQLSLTGGTWTNSVGSLAYSWYRCPSASFSTTDCTLISSQSASTYTLTAADVDQFVFGAVTAANVDGVTTTAPSQASGRVTGPTTNSSTPTLINTSQPNGVRVGDVVLLTDGSWTNASGSLSYSWYTCASVGVADPTTSSACSLVPGATMNTLTVDAALTGKYLYGVVTAQGSDGTSAYASSLAFPSSVVDTPSAPTVASVTPNALGDAAVVAIGVPSSNGGSAITAYVVYAYDVNGQQVGTCSTTSLACTVRGLTPGATYSFKVLARNGVGDSSLSAATRVTMVATYAKVNAYIRGYAFAQSDLSASMFGQIRATVKKIVSSNNTHVTVTGFANFKATKRLSRDRAANVANYLRAQLRKAGRTDITVTTVVGGNTNKFGGAVLNRVVVIQGR